MSAARLCLWTLAFAALSAAPALGQDAASYTLDVSAACADDPAARALADAVAVRLPELRRTSRGGDVAVSWRPAPSGECAVTVISAEGEATVLQLAEYADGAAIEEAASRVAWLALVATGSDPFAFEPDPDDTTPPPEPPPPQPEAPATPPHVGFGASLTPGVFGPRAAGPDTTRGVSLSLFGSRTAGIRGFEFGLGYNRSDGPVHGAQVGFVANRAGSIRGAQLSTFFNLCDEGGEGAQVALVNACGGRLVGAQSGLVNRAVHLDGGQVGLFNSARDVDVQLGLINVARESAASIGLVSIVRDAPVRLSLVGSSDRTLEVGVRHGSDAVHNLLMVGYAAGRNDERLALVSYGMGGHVEFGRFFFDLDGIGGVLIGPHTRNGAASTGVAAALFRLRVSIGWQAADRFAIFGGVSPTFLFAEPELDVPIGPADPIDFGSTDATVLGWATAHLGLRF